MKVYATLGEARAVKALRLAHQDPRLPPRLWPVVVHGPDEGYAVVDLGFATANDLTIVPDNHNNSEMAR